MWTADHTCGRSTNLAAARRAAEQARDDDRVEETQSFAEEAEGTNGEEKKEEKDRTNSAVKTLCT